MKTPTATAADVAAALPFPAYPEAQMDVRHDRIHLGWDGETPDGFEPPVLACEPVGDDVADVLENTTQGQFPDAATLRWAMYDYDGTGMHETSDLDETAPLSEVVAWAATTARKHLRDIPRIKG